MCEPNCITLVRGGGAVQGPGDGAGVGEGHPAPISGRPVGNGLIALVCFVCLARLLGNLLLYHGTRRKHYP